MMRPTPNLRAVAVLFLFAFPGGTLSAGEIWDGGGVNSNWTTGNNWNGIPGFQFPPPNNGMANIRMTGNNNTVPNVDIPYSINSLTFDSGIPSFFITGQELTIGAGGVTNNDNSGQVVLAPVKLIADQTWLAAAGPLQIGAVNLDGFDLTIGFIPGPPNNVAFPTSLISEISGVGDLILPVGYPSAVTMSGTGSNTYVGDTTVGFGTLVLQKTGEAIPGDLSVGAGFADSAVVRLGANEQISHAPTARVTVGGGGLLDLNGHTETINQLQFVGDAAVTTGAGKLILAGNVFTSNALAVGVAAITGSLDLNGGTRTIDDNPTTTHLLLDSVVSNGSVRFGGVVELRGAPNTYTGLTVVEDRGEVSLNKPAADGALRGDVTIQGAVFLLRNEQILAAPGNEVFLEAGGRLDLNGFSETLQDLTLNGGRIFGDGGTLSVLGTITHLESVGDAEIRARLNLQGIRVFSVQGNALSGSLNLYDVVSNGSIVKTGPGPLRLLNTGNTYAGGTFLNEGTVDAAADGSLGAAAAPIHFDGGVLRVNGASFTTTARSMTWGPNGGGVDVSSTSGVFTLNTQTLSGPGPLTKFGPGKLVFVAPQSYTGGTTVSGGTLEGNTQSLQGNVVNNATLSFNQTSDGTYAGNLTGSGTLNKLGAGRLLLAGVNTYSGITAINAGTLESAGGSAIGDLSAVTLANAAGVLLNLAGSSETIGSLAGGGASGGNVNLGTGTLTTGGNDTSTTYAGVISGGGSVSKTGRGTWTLAGNNAYSGGTTFAGGATNASSDTNLGDPAGPLRFDGGTLRTTGGFNITARTVQLLAGGGGLDIANAANSFTYAGTITGPGGLAKVGVGTLELSGNNSYGGPTTINTGRLRALGGNAIPDGSAVTLANSAAAVLDLGDSSETIGSLAGGGPTGGNVALGDGTLTTGGDNSSTVFAGAITGAGGLRKTGTGVFTLSANNSYAGLTDVQQGRLRLGSATAVPQNNALNVGTSGTFDSNNFDKAFSALTGSGQITLGTGNLTIGATDASSSFTGGITGSGSLTKVGTGTFSLDGVTSYTGGTTVTAGELRGPAGGLQGDVINQAVVEFAQVTDGTYTGILSGPGSLIKTGPGRTTISTAATYIGSTTISAGTLAVPNTLNTPGGGIAIEPNGTLEASGVVQRAVVGTGQLTATGNLVVGDPGSTGGFNFAGAVHVGTHSVVLLDADRARLGGGTIAGGSLDTLAGAELTGTLSGHGRIKDAFINNGSVAGPALPLALTFAGPLSGAGSFTGNIRILDSFSPGNSPAAVSLENVSLGDGAVLTMELAGLLAGEEYDTLSVSGTAHLDGLLQVVRDPAWVRGPQFGDEFGLLQGGRIEGTFDEMVLPALSGELSWQVFQTPQQLKLVVVPEPSTALLMIAGGLLLRVRRNSSARRTDPARPGGAAAENRTGSPIRPVRTRRRRFSFPLGRALRGCGRSGA